VRRRHGLDDGDGDGRAISAPFTGGGAGKGSG
jgi:hypothetical protein